MYITYWLCTKNKWLLSNQTIKRYWKMQRTPKEHDCLYKIFCVVRCIPIFYEQELPDINRNRNTVPFSFGHFCGSILLLIYPVRSSHRRLLENTPLNGCLRKKRRRPMLLNAFSVCSNTTITSYYTHGCVYKMNHPLTRDLDHGTWDLLEWF